MIAFRPANKSAFDMFSAIQNPGHWLLGTVAITALTVGSADAVPNPFASKLPGTWSGELEFKAAAPPIMVPNAQVSIAANGRVPFTVQFRNVTGHGVLRYENTIRAGGCTVKSVADIKVRIDGAYDPGVEFGKGKLDLNIHSRRSGFGGSVACPGRKTAKIPPPPGSNREITSTVSLPITRDGNESPSPAGSPLVGSLILHLPCAFNPDSASRPSVELDPDPLVGPMWSQNGDQIFDSKQLAAMADKEPANWDVPGMVSVRFHGVGDKRSNGNVTTGASKAKYGSGYCAWVDKIVGTPPPGEIPLRMYLASQLKVGNPCYAAVLTHEQRHINDDEPLLKDFAKKLTADLDSSLLPRHDIPILLPADSSDVAQDEIFNLVNGVVKADQVDFKSQARHRASQIDTAAEYAAVRTKCPGW
ncbi:MAG: hypothetical protein WBP86_15590 [Thiobacillaceae bacterium]